MSQEKTPSRAITKVNSETQRMKRALGVYKNWIWRDKIDIAALRTRMKNLEDDLASLKSFLDRILHRSDN